ncbi:MAG: hypothetical protein Q9217_001834 [Psora testacea]
MDEALEGTTLKTAARLRELEQQKFEKNTFQKKQMSVPAAPSSLIPSSASSPSSDKRQSSTPPRHHFHQPVQGRAQDNLTSTRRASEPSLKVQDSLGTGRRRSVDPSEALKRGRSFGPLINAGAHHSVFKTSGKSSILAWNPEAREEEVASSTRQNVLAGESGTLGIDKGKPKSSDTCSDDDEERGRKRTVDGPETSPESPTVTVTPPMGEKTTSKRFIIKPKVTSDHKVSRERPVSPTAADLENLEEIRKAQRLGVTISTTDTPESHRVIRTIIRGDYDYFQAQAREENMHMRLRTYLVAVNLKPEAAYATEWAIGTVLRDGDTLIAIFAADKDAETGLPEDGLPVGEGGKAMQETTLEIEKMTAASQKSSRLFGMKSLLPGSRKSSVAAEARLSKNSKKQQERMHALEKLSDLCVDLLRKTKLQVRIVIEVIHCKVARYMLTEAIDVLQPTLVIVGSRGRSVMKGALAGSISRYLIMKSSVPVMTARMKLSNRKAKSPPPKVRLGNNLVPSKRFADVKIDGPESRLDERANHDRELKA